MIVEEVEDIFFGALRAGHVRAHHPSKKKRTRRKEVRKMTPISPTTKKVLRRVGLFFFFFFWFFSPPTFCKATNNIQNSCQKVYKVCTGLGSKPSHLCGFRHEDGAPSVVVDELQPELTGVSLGNRLSCKILLLPTLTLPTS
jgi:hypothetical protein